MMKNKILDIIAKIEFWYSKKFIKLDKHYTFFVDLSGKDGTFAIKYLKKYSGVIVEFGNVQVSGDTGMMTFDYDIIANPNNCNVKSKGFARFTSMVMRSILFGAIENAMQVNDENRNIDLVESGEEREVHEEVASVPEERVSNRKPRKKTVRRNKAIHS